MRPHRRQPTRLPHPWDSSDKNTGVGCHFLLQCMKVKSLSRVRLLATPWTAAHQAPPSLGFSRQGYWSGVPLQSFLILQAFNPMISFSLFLFFISLLLLSFPTLLPPISQTQNCPICFDFSLPSVSYSQLVTKFCRFNLLHVFLMFPMNFIHVANLRPARPSLIWLL